MNKVFEEQYGEGNVEFCRYAFGWTSDVLTWDQILENSLEEKRFNCYDYNQKHVEYCYDSLEMGYNEMASNEDLKKCLTE